MIPEQVSLEKTPWSILVMIVAAENLKQDIFQKKKEKKEKFNSRDLFW